MSTQQLHALGEALFRSAFDDGAVAMAVVAAADGDARVIETNTKMRELAFALGHHRNDTAARGGAHEPHATPDGELLALAPDALPTLTLSELLGGYGRTLGADWNPGERWQRELVVTDDDGANRVLLVSTSPVRDVEVSRPLAVVHVEDVTEQHAAREELTFNALHDALTGLPNRTMIEQRLAHAQQRSDRTDLYIGVLFVDLDNFKNVNDLHGHAAGDRLLIEVAERFSRTVRLVDTAARLSGDEFVVLCEDLDADRRVAEQELAEIAQRLHATFDAPFFIDERRSWVSASIGMHLVRGSSESMPSVLSNADAAMYRAKALGRARTEAFDARLRRQLVDRLQLADDLRFAEEREQLHVAYQPIVLLHTGQPVAAEALLRWDLPGVGSVPPARFIEIAEESALINDLGDFVLDDLCDRLVDNPAIDFATMNVSARQLSQPDFVERLRTALERRGIEPRRLAIELTENVLMDAAGSSIRQLAELRRLGVPVGVDDFGTGYASLTYLRNLPVSFVKVDRAFVAGMTTNDGDRAIVGAVLHLATSLGLLSIAEGVERAEQAHLLTEMGCTYAQGFYFGRPQPRSLDFGTTLATG